MRPKTKPTPKYINLPSLSFLVSEFAEKSPNAGPAVLDSREMGRRLSMHVSNQVGFSGPAVWTNHEAGRSWGRAERKLRDAKEEREEANEKDDQFSSINSPIQRDVEEERCGIGVTCAAF